MKTVAIIQARMASTRFPGKVLYPIHGKPMLQWVVEAVKRAKCVDEICIATTDQRDDDDICATALALRVKTFRGESEDVLGRLWSAATMLRADCIVRVCGDCPCLCSEFIYEVVSAVVHYGADYAAVRDKRGEPLIIKPYGITCEAFTRYVLDREVLSLNADHEHVTKGMYTCLALMQ